MENFREEEKVMYTEKELDLLLSEATNLEEMKAISLVLFDDKLSYNIHWLLQITVDFRTKFEDIKLKMN